MNSASRLDLETLEPRLAMTGLSAAIGGGVLAIVGTPDSNTITLDYDKTTITVVETSQSFPRSAFSSIEILTGDGDDIVRLNDIGPKKPKWLGVAVTVRAEGGNDRLIDAVDNVYYFGGPTEVLTFTRKGAARIDGKKLSWMDESLADTALRTLAETQLADKQLSREEMLSLFESAGSDDLVSSAEFVSLQTLVSNQSLFRKREDIWTLSQYVVLGTTANEFYQQCELGNLQVGSTGEHLQKLVNKWFLGLDHPEAYDLDTFAEFEYRQATGTLFVDGISYTDIRQGNLGDCYLLASLGAIAVHSPKPIANMFIVNGDGTYTIRFYQDEAPYYITVDSQLPVNQFNRLVFASAGMRYDNPGNELWVPLIEKAYAQLAEFGWLDTGGGDENSYAAINAGWPGDTTGQATGETVIDLLVLDNPTVITKAFSADRAITFITPTLPASPDVVGNHVYAMVGYDSKTREFLVFNPWGLNNGSVPGLLSFTWDEMQQNFYSWDYGPKV